jgi:heat shock protein 1/8
VQAQSVLKIIVNDQGDRTLPSYVAFSETEPAKNQAAMNPQNTIFDAKRLIGRMFNDKTVRHDMKLWSFKVVNEAGRPVIEVRYLDTIRKFKPEEISAMVLTFFYRYT